MEVCLDKVRKEVEKNNSCRREHETENWIMGEVVEAVDEVVEAMGKMRIEEDRGAGEYV